MKIQLLSDLHIEFWPNNHTLDSYLTDADVLVLAGDINVGRTNTLKTLNYFSKHYKHVVYVIGNHEEYGQEFKAFLDMYNFGMKLPKNVYFLDQDGFKLIDDIAFFGSCLYTNFGNDPIAEHIAGYGITDFRRIKNLSTKQYSLEYDSTVNFIRKMYDTFPGNKKVIVTHFLPATECISPRFRGENLLNKYFANNLGQYISTLENTTWMFGHTHDSVDFYIGDTRMLCNPYGYQNHEVNPFFNPKLTISL